MAHNHDEIRAGIVEVARDVFSRYGYKKTTLDDIASSLYRVKSSLYYYFKNKEDLFRAVIDFEADRAKKIINEAINRQDNPEAKIRIFFNTILEFINETSNFYKLLQEDMLDVMGFANDVKRDHSKESSEIIAGFLREGVADGSFSITDINATTDAIMVAMIGIYNPYTTTYHITHRELNTLLDMIFVGLRTR